MNIKNFCIWEFQDGDDYYETYCNNSFCFLEGFIKENNFKFCPFCGKSIKEEKNNGK